MQYYELNLCAAMRVGGVGCRERERDTGDGEEGGGAGAKAPAGRIRDLVRGPYATNQTSSYVARGMEERVEELVRSVAQVVLKV